MSSPITVDPVAMLMGLLERPSYSRQEREAVDYLVDQMATVGFDRAYRDEAGNAVGILGDGPREIVLIGHIDTVPGIIPVKVVDGLLYGRGSVDAKGPLATFAAGAVRAGRQPGWKIVVIGAVEEEFMTSKGARFAVTQFHPELCVIGEPSSWDRVTLGYKGWVLLDCHVSRALTHTARPEPSAVEQAVDFWNAAKAYADGVNRDRERAFDHVMPSLRTIRSSDDGFIESADMSLSFRLPVDIPPQVLKEVLTPLAGRAELTWRGEIVAFRAEKNTPLTRLFLNAIRDVGGRPSYVYKTGTSDMNVVGPVWKCPIVAYGPGDSTLDHTPEEHLPLEDYERAIQVIANVMRGLGTV